MQRNLLLVMLVLSVVLLGLSVAPNGAAGRQSPPLPADTVVQSRLNHPWDVAFAPDGRMFLTERDGSLRIYASGEPFAPLRATQTVTVRAQSEAGLMGLAFDPDFSNNRYLYVCASREDEGEWRNQVLRYLVTGDSIGAESYVIRRGIRANRHHNGCRVRFGPDGKLWVTTGDAEDAGRSQDPSALNGKVLRVESDGGVPPDNPILPGAAEPTVAYSMGHRNPQGVTFQPGTGLPFVSEHAHHRITPVRTDHDAIYLVQPGANFGWPEFAGPETGYAQPAWTSGDLRTATPAVSGTTFLTGAAWGEWEGSLVVAALKGEALLHFEVQGSTVTFADKLLERRYGRLRSPVVGPEGDLYVTTDTGNDSDVVVRIAPVTGQAGIQGGQAYGQAGQ